MTAISWLEYRREAVLAGEIWRLWSGHFVHYSTNHAAMDGLACLILAFALCRMGAGHHLLPRMALIAPLISLALFFALPDMTRYRGASALAMALTAGLGVTLWQARPAWRIGLFLLAVALALKIAADALSIAPLLSSLPAGVRVAWQAHVAGLVSGLLAWHLAAKRP